MRKMPRAPSNVPRRPARMPNVLFPVLFSSIAAALVYFLLYFFLPSGPAKKLAEASRPIPGPATKAESVPNPPVMVKPAAPLAATPPPVLVVPAIPAPLPNERPGLRTDGPPPAVVANEMLDAFLRAKDAAGRVDMVEPAVPVIAMAPLVELIAAPLSR